MAGNHRSIKLPRCDSSSAANMNASADPVDPSTDLIDQLGCVSQRTARVTAGAGVAHINVPP